SLSSRTINSCGDKPYHGHQPKPYQQSPPSQQQPTVLYSENQVRIAGGSCDALFICSKGTTQSPRLRARCKTESSEESVSSWKNHENTNQQQRRYTGRNCRDTLVVFDFKYFFRGIDCGCDGNNAKVEFPFLSEEVCGIEGAVRTSRKSWTSCAQNAAATRIEAWSVEADFLVSEELYCRVDALQEDHGDIIHKRVDLLDGAKLTYFRGCLTGDAWPTIAYLFTTNADYKVAVQSLKERFEWHFASIRKNEGEKPKPVSVNLISLNESGWTRLQLVQAIAHGDRGKRMILNCLFDTATERLFVKQDVADELGLRSETFSIAVHGFGGGNREAQKLQLVPLAGESRHPIKILTVETLCHNIVEVNSEVLPEEDGDEVLPVRVVIGVHYFSCMLGRRSSKEVRLRHCVICAPQPLPLTPSAGSLDAAKQTVATLAKPSQPSRVTATLSDVKRILSPPVESSPHVQVCGPDPVEVLGVGSDWDQLGTRGISGRQACRQAVGSVKEEADARLEKTEGKGSTDDVKFRIVFDGSAQYGGIFLNDWLKPNFQADLLVESSFASGVTGPVCKQTVPPILENKPLMRRQWTGYCNPTVSPEHRYPEDVLARVALHEEDRDICRFLWREPGSDDPPKAYRLTRVCFGLTCSPYVAIQMIYLNAERHQAEFIGGTHRDLAQHVRGRPSYELCCTGIALAKRLAGEATRLLGKGGFQHAKWASNLPDVVKDVLAEDQESSARGRLWKTLRILWQREADGEDDNSAAVARWNHMVRSGAIRTECTVVDLKGGVTGFRMELHGFADAYGKAGDEIKSGPDQVPELAAFACCITHGGASVRTAVGLRQLRVGNGHQEVRLLEQQHPYSVLDEGRLLTVEALRCQLSEGDPGTVISRQNLVVVWIKVDPGGRNILAGPDVIEGHRPDSVKQLREVAYALSTKYGCPPYYGGRMKELKEFCLFLDDEGVLKVGGCLRLANLPTEMKHPMLLQHGDEIVKMIILHVHH
ncbi:hypothetical protein T4A_1743, partial [Trichinella pseudospiralis]